MDKFTFENQWTNYVTSHASLKNNRTASGAAVTGGMIAATGAAVFSLSSQANAAIIYEHVNQTVPFNVNGGVSTGTFHLNISSHSPGIVLKGYGYAGAPYGGVKAIGGNLLTNGAASHAVKKLANGSAITAAGPFALASTAGAPVFGLPIRIKKGGGTDVSGSFPINASGYFIGFQAANGDLGYIELSIGNDGNGGDPNLPDSFTIKAFAVNTESGQFIGAGELPPVPEASNTLAALLLLACAGGSLTSWRQRKQAVAVA